MERNYELNEYYEYVCKNFAAKAADSYKYSYSSATKLQIQFVTICIIRAIRSFNIKF